MGKPEWDAFKNEFRTLATCIPKEYAPLVDNKRGKLSRSMYIRRLIEADLSNEIRNLRTDSASEPAA